MVRIAHQRVFPTPVERAFAAITDMDNWPAYWPSLVRVEPESRWDQPGDHARLLLRLLGREVELGMTLCRLVPNQLVTYTSTQAGLPDAYHERRFHPLEGGCTYSISIEYEPRRGPRGLFDRTVVRHGVDRAVRQTMRSLERFLA